MAEHGFLAVPLQLYDRIFSLHEPSVTWKGTMGLHLLPFTSSLLYIAMVYLLPPYLIKNKYNLAKSVKPWMAGWNLFLSLLSGFTFLGLAGPMFSLITKTGVWEVVCNDNWQYIPRTGTYIFWAALFTYLKYFELVDTLFLILKNPTREVPFLHWYHHFTVLIFTWYAANWDLSIGWEFAVINSLVHTFMYWYYFQMERGIRPWWAKPLTIGQISQMIAGLTLNGLWYYGYTNGYRCSCTQPTLLITMGVTIYASYLFLFSKYFIERYIWKKVKTE